MKILVPVDGSQAALDGVRCALRLHREGLRADFLLVTVQEPTYVYEMLMASDTGVRERASTAAAAHALKDAEALFRAVGVPFEREIGRGDPAQTLVEMVERNECDAVIIAARGRGALRSAALGSVSQALLHASSIPVMIVKHRAVDGR